MARQRSHGSGSLFKRKGSGPWIASWSDHTGRRRTASTRTTDRAAAGRILAKRVADVALRREGVIDVKTDQYREAEARPLIDHLNGIEEKTSGGRPRRVLVGFKHHLEDKGGTPKHVRQTHGYAVRMVELSGARYISELSPSRVLDAIGVIRGG